MDIRQSHIKGDNSMAKVIHLDLTGPEFSLISVGLAEAITNTPPAIMQQVYGRELATLTYKHAVALLKGHDEGLYEVGDVQELRDMVAHIEEAHGEVLDLLKAQDEASVVLTDASARAAGLADDPRAVGH